MNEGLFRSFFLGGFECSTHLRTEGMRLDLISSTCHDRFAELDYQRLLEYGIGACRDGLRWHLIETVPGRFDFAPDLPMITAAKKAGIQVVWDLFHYGWPEDIDIFSAEFIDRFTQFCYAAASVISDYTDGPPWFSVINEPSFFCWAGGQVGLFPPFAVERGEELKRQLVRATIAGIKAIRHVNPEARFLQVDPLIHIVSRRFDSSALKAEAAAYRAAQFHCWDMIAGFLNPELGGKPEYLDVVGCNYYVYNQWEYNGTWLRRTDPRYKPLRELLKEVSERYTRPVLLAETGIENKERPQWLAFVAAEVAAALRSGVQVEGICLYPIVNHPGWADDRHCHNGLWDYCNESGHREIYRPLAHELRSQQRRIEEVISSSECDRRALEVCA